MWSPSSFSCVNGCVNVKNGCDKQAFHRYFCPNGPSDVVHSSHWEHLKTCASCPKPMSPAMSPAKESDGDEKDAVHDDWQGYEESRGIARDMAAAQKKRLRDARDVQEARPVHEEDGNLSWEYIDQKQLQVGDMMLEYYSTTQIPSITVGGFLDIWRDHVIAAREKEKRVKRELMLYLNVLGSYLKKE